eukprot:2389312-Amphidinium_carterae.1
MDLVDTAVTRITGDAVLDTLIRKKEFGYHFQASSSLCCTVYRAEFLAVVGALEDYQPHEVVIVTVNG